MAGILQLLNPLVLDGMELAFSEQVKSLGVVMDSALHLEKQVGMAANITF